MNTNNFTEIKYLTGYIKIKPVEFTLYRMSDGSGKMFGDFCSITGDYESLLYGAILAGMPPLVALVLFNS